MRYQKLLAALAMTAGLAVPAALAAAPPAGATTTALTCRVELDYIQAYDVDESDGKDELRISLAGTLYPGGWVDMRLGDRAYSGAFGYPGITISSAGSAVYSLREVTPPIVGGGTQLGTITARGSTCATLATGQSVNIWKYMNGTDDTAFSYYIRLVMTGL